MLLQSLVVIAAMLVLSGSILVETLVAAKASLHQAMLARTQTAMSDATASFVRWAQDRVATYGAGNASAWPGQAGPLQDPSICPAAASPPDGSTPAPCSFAAFDTWQIHGSTASGRGAPEGSPPPGVPEARNLAPTVNEQRLAATITVRITDVNGRTIFADRSREVTARVFEAPPYIVITGTRDVVTEAGSIHAAEGDTAGAAQFGALGGEDYATPNPQFPAADTDTRIRTSVDCLNRPDYATNQEIVAAQPGEIDYSFHPYGNQDWAYEAPCVPPEGNPTPPAGTLGYLPPSGSTYATAPDDSRTTSWNPGNENQTTFPR